MKARRNVRFPRGGIRPAFWAPEPLESRRLLAGIPQLLFSTLDGRLGEMNLAATGDVPAGMAYNLRPTFGANAPIDIIRNPYGLLLTLFESTTSSEVTLRRFDPITGDALFNFLPGSAPDVSEGDLAYNPATRFIWASQSMAFGNLSVVNTNTRDIRTVSSPAFTPKTINGLEFLPAALFGLSGDYVLVGLGGLGERTDTLFLIDQDTGAVSNVVPLSRSLGTTAGFVRDPATGDCYVADGGDPNVSGALYRLNPVTGVLTLIGSMNLPGGASGLALGEVDDALPTLPATGRISEVADLVYGPASVAASIDFLGDADFVPYSSLRVEPIGAPSFVRLKLDVLDAQGRVVSTALSPTAGAPIYYSLPPAGAATQGYSIRITDASGLDVVSYYRLTAVANAATEAEAIGGTVNDSIATAQNFDVSALALDSPGQTVRLATRGYLNADAAAQDWYSFTVNPGEPITIGLEQGPAGYYAAPPDLTQVLKLDLYDAAGELLISGFDPGSSRLAFEQVIQRFAVDISRPTPLYARITNDPAATSPAGKVYDLVVVRNADLEIEGNDGDGTPTPLILRRGLGTGGGFGARVLGDQRFRVGFPDPDDYTIELAAGGAVHFDLTRPPVPPFALEFGSVPTMQLLDAAGAQVASGTYVNPSRVTMDHTPAARGVYRIKVIGGPNSAGEFVLSATAASAPAAVFGRRIFYNNSGFDAVSDDLAVAPDKRALPPNAAASFANVTSYAKGINGLMIDVANVPADAGTLSSSDIGVRVSGGATPTGWSAGPAPSTVSVRRGAGDGGSDRVTLIWPDGAILNRWLEITLKADDRTGLSTPDVFIWGNLVGETGDISAPSAVTSADLVRLRNAVGSPAGLASRFDIDRNGVVSAADLVVVRNRLGVVLAPPAVFSRRRIGERDGNAEWVE